jgi:hypothetical protein
MWAVSFKNVVSDVGGKPFPGYCSGQKLEQQRRERDTSHSFVHMKG